MADTAAPNKKEEGSGFPAEVRASVASVSL